MYQGIKVSKYQSFFNKDRDVTTVFTYTHENTPLSQSEPCSILVI